MNSETRNQPADVRFRPAGVGHASKWACGACAKPQWSMLGRKLRRVRGVKTWVCAGCAQ